jgi:hypothetical protein
MDLDLDMGIGTGMDMYTNMYIDLDVRYRYQASFYIRHNFRLQPLQPNKKGSAIRLGLILFSTDIRLCAHLCIEHRPQLRRTL